MHPSILCRESSLLESVGYGWEIKTTGPKRPRAEFITCGLTANDLGSTLVLNILSV